LESFPIQFPFSKLVHSLHSFVQQIFWFPFGQYSWNGLCRHVVFKVFVWKKEAKTL
jgi:hypothetical protein